MSLRLLTRYGLPRDMTPPPPAFSPDDINDLRAWFDASDASSLTLAEDDTEVSEWQNKAGASYDLDATAAQRPTYSPASLNGKATVRFESGDAFRMLDRDLISGLPGVTIAFVLRLRETSASGRPWISIAAGTVGASWLGAAFDTSSGADRYRVTGRRVFSDSFAADAGADGLSGWHVAVVRFDYQGRLAQTLVGGEVKAEINPFQASGDSDSQNAHSIAVGSNAARNGSWFMGDMAEIVVYERALGSQEVSDLVAYLEAKWDV